jgi:hypothetical protein
MRQSLTLGIAFGVAALFIVDAAYAQNPPWCAIMDNNGTMQCNFYTQQQCLQTISGIGGECILNPGGNAPNSGQRAPLFGPLFGPPSGNAQGPPPGLGAVPPPPNN